MKYSGSYVKKFWMDPKLVVEKRLIIANDKCEEEEEDFLNEDALVLTAARVKRDESGQVWGVIAAVVVSGVVVVVGGVVAWWGKIRREMGRKRTGFGGEGYERIALL